MHRNRHRIIIAIAFGILGMYACMADNNTQPDIFLPVTATSVVPHDPSIPTTGDLCNNPYIPIKTGSTWTYRSTGGPDGDFTYTKTITETHPDHFIVDYQFSNSSRSQEWICDTEGIRSLKPGDETTASLTAQEIAAEFTTQEALGYIFPKLITPGMQWQYGLKMQGPPLSNDPNTLSTGTYTVTVQEFGVDTVTTPAGTFNTVKFQASTIVNITADFEGVQIPVAINSSSVIWYSPNVGFVKSVEGSDFSGTAYTATTELQSYFIP